MLTLSKGELQVTALEPAEPPPTLLLMLRWEENDYESVSSGEAV